MAEITGVLIFKDEVKQITEKFTKQDFVIKTTDEYPQEIILEVQNEKISLLQDKAIGCLLRVTYNLTGRCIAKEEKRSWFLTLRAWKISLFS